MYLYTLKSFVLYYAQEGHKVWFSSEELRSSVRQEMGDKCGGFKYVGSFIMA
jgi:hypothetical protein